MQITGSIIAGLITAATWKVSLDAKNVEPPEFNPPVDRRFVRGSLVKFAPVQSGAVEVQVIVSEQ